MEINELDQILEKLRIIESVSEIVMLSMDDNDIAGDLVKSSYDTWLDLMGKETRQIRKMLQK